MSRNLSVCHDGFLDLGYDAVSFPNFIESPTGHHSGIFPDFFSDAARLLGCSKGTRYVKFPANATVCDNGTCYNAFDQKIRSGEIFSCASSTYLRTSNVRLVANTVPISMNMKVVFLERQPKISLDTRLIFYTVFAYDALLAIFIVLSIIGLIEFLQNRMEKRFGKAECPPDGEFSRSRSLNLPGATFIFFGLALLGYIYQAKYNGNNTITGKNAKTIQSALAFVSKGLERFAYPGPSLFSDDEARTISNGPAYTIINDDNDRLREVCENPPRSVLSAHYALEVLRFSEMNDINRWCRLSSIAYDPRGGPLPVSWINTSMITGYFYNFYLSRRMPRKTVETLNFLILSFYNYDQQSTILLHKYVTKLPLAERILNGDADFTVDESPFSMMQLELPLIFLALGYTTSWAAFLVELLFLPYLKMLLEKKIEPEPAV